MSTITYRASRLYGKTTHEVQEGLQIDLEGRIAIDLVTRWGTVAAVEDGEDSAGRQKLRLQTPEELVARAVATAKVLVAALKENGNTLLLPALQDEPDKDD